MELRKADVRRYLEPSPDRRTSATHGHFQLVALRLHELFPPIKVKSILRTSDVWLSAAGEARALHGLVCASACFRLLGVFCARSLPSLTSRGDMDLFDPIP